MNRRDLLLNEMQITQWVLKKPYALKGDAQIRLDSQIKFVVICEEDQQQSPLFHDILRTLQLTTADYRWIDCEQAKRLSFNHRPFFWLIGTPQAVGFREKIAKCPQSQLENWQSLRTASAKRAFWQAIQRICPNLEEPS